tara:strand:+ start:1719 stop:2312 length:594 start_codon:yes stop_codon:yes gene_type:complete
MIRVNKMFKRILFLLLILFPLTAEGKVLSMGGPGAKITIKVFSSLTCPHCANFHNNIFENLKREYLDKGTVKFEHHSFPLDLAALNAEIIIRCQNNNLKSFQLLGEIYKKQKKWAVGSDINIINKSIFEIGATNGLAKEEMNKCLKNDKFQEDVLNERIEAQKKYKISSTPTIYINENKYNGEHEYKDLKKEIDKLL